MQIWYMKRSRWILAVALTAVMSAAATAHADIYAYWDENGTLNYTNVRKYPDRYKYITVSKEPKLKARRSRGGVKAVTPPAYVEELVAQAARTYDVDQSLVHAVIHAESSYNPRAVSPKGAQGLMQLMPATAQRFGVRDVFDPAQNVRAGVRYLKHLLQMFGQDTALAVAAYNAGENAVVRHRGIPPYPETVNYVNKVLQLHSRYGKG